LHQAEFMQAPDMATFQRFQAWARGRIVLLTVAPELSGVDALIQSATQQGVVVSLGHHYADRAAILRAIRAGARGATHLGNGLPQEINRHHNPLWPQLAADELTGMFITDGHHLPPDFIGVALRAKTPARFIVTSDAAPLAGLPAGSYALYGEQVEIEPSGRIICPATGYLAGSHSTQLECMNVLAALRLLSEEQLWQVGYRNPLALLGKGPQALDGLAGPQVRYADGAFHIQQAL
jgi:N-acetylglucosamine-6-phosphate deacetylase